MGKNTQQLIEEFANMGHRCAISLKDGRYLEGYILDVREKEFVFGEGGPLAPDKDCVFSNAELDFAKLSFYDAEESCWKDVSWSETSQTWTMRRSPPQ